MGEKQNECRLSGTFTSEHTFSIARYKQLLYDIYYDMA